MHGNLGAGVVRGSPEGTWPGMCHVIPEILLCSTATVPELCKSFEVSFAIFGWNLVQPSQTRVKEAVDCQQSLTGHDQWSV